MEKAEIEFRVPKLWVKEHNIDPSTIKLLRFEDGKWTELPTSPIDEEDIEFLYFSANTSGFSIFAVVGEPFAAFNIMLIAIVVGLLIGSIIIFFAARSRRFPIKL